MKHKVLFLVFILILLTACSATFQSQLPPGVRLSQLKAEQTNTAGDAGIQLVGIANSIRQGGAGNLTIKGQPGVTYSAAVTFKQGDKMVTVVESHPAGSDGRVTWNWLVKRDTAPGTYPIIISGGGKTFITSYTVTS
ncbi:MAG: hypothetical protein QHH06_00060 [Clostridiales bacterium]|jgi:hypothetical protein|nr:hypothetical protein [Eubacteriales bacterium]MDH7564863.1 hypothetical protein [Clostridiales bacterium]